LSRGKISGKIHSSGSPASKTKGLRWTGGGLGVGFLFWRGRKSHNKSFQLNSILLKIDDIHSLNKHLYSLVKGISIELSLIFFTFLRKIIIFISRIAP